MLKYEIGNNTGRNLASEGVSKGYLLAVNIGFPHIHMQFIHKCG